VHTILTLIFIASLNPIIQQIERSFLQNEAKFLYKLFSSKTSISIFLPEPISFSDSLSNEQAYYFFIKTFSSYSTLEFFLETKPFVTQEKEPLILKARWSFMNKKNSNQYVFNLFLLLLKEKKDGKNNSEEGAWKIIEMRAEKI